MHGYNQSQPIVERVRVLDGVLEFVDHSTDSKIFEITKDSVKFINSSGVTVLEVNNNALKWLGGSVIADSSRSTIDITSDDFTKSITCNSGQVMDLHVYVERPGSVAYALVHAEIINWKGTFLPKVTLISSEAVKAGGNDIDVTLNTSIGGQTIDINIKNASGGKLVYESRYRLSMNY